jgi:putative SOS response-associated peptidase YedK
LPRDLDDTFRQIDWLGDEIFPKRAAPILRKHEGATIAEEMVWGVPLAIGGKAPKPVTNIRNLSSPFWRGTLGKTEYRCLVPVIQFAEWEGEKGSKRVVWFEMVDQMPFMFAGTWRPTPEGHRFAFLTCDPNDLVRPVHPKAMPVILLPEDYNRWLDGEAAEQFQQPFPSQLMRISAG